MTYKLLEETESQSMPKQQDNSAIVYKPLEVKKAGMVVSHQVHFRAIRLQLVLHLLGMNSRSSK